ncbi:MAG: GNAT family N-acetyltransferase [Pseudohongiellaceae bacterium]
MSQPQIRPATRDDIDLILHFIHELAVCEKLAHEVKTNPDMIEQTLFGANPKSFCLICELNAEPVASAIYFYSYSTWLGKYGIYPEELYVSPEHRGKGAGKGWWCILPESRWQMAVAEDCGRFKWSVLDWNTPSIEFYKSLERSRCPSGVSTG